MSHLQLGTTLLHKYRIDRVRLESRDAILYEATDTMHARRVCIKLLRSERLTGDEAHAANVVDIGRTMGMPYIVTSEWVRAVPPPPPRRASKPPPPLPSKPPSKPASKPPPLPRARAPQPPVEVADDAPTIDAELRLPRGLKRSSPWPVIAILVAAAITGIVGWSIGQRESHPAPATIATEHASVTEAPPPKTDVQPIVAKPPPTHTEEVVEAPPPRRHKGSTDPLTL